MSAFLLPKPAENEFVAALARRTEALDGLSPEARREALDEATRLVERSVQPAYRRVLALLDEWHPRTTDDAGLWRLPDGGRAYAQRRAQALFNLQPRAGVEVRREGPLAERSASAHYTTPAPDGSRSGIFWAPLPDPHYDLLRVRSLAVHEAVPGHHFQLALQQEQTDLPRWRGLGAVRRTPGAGRRLVRGRHAGAAGRTGQSALPRAPPGGRHRAARAALDAPAGHRLRPAGARGRTLCLQPGAGLRLHDRHAPHP